tara:strand:+ start:201 stop:1640 length:1440 start_codon:yes stop_codon:yes gene_type:complete
MSDLRDFTGKNRKFTGTTGIVASDTDATTSNRVDEKGRIRFNNTLGLMEYYNGTTWIIIDAPPSVSSISPSTISEAGTNVDIVISGSNFSTGATAEMVPESGGTSVTFDTVTRDSSTQMTVRINNVTSKFSGSFDEPYDIKVTNSSGLSNSLSDALSINEAPTWTTSAGSLGNAITGVALSPSITLAATDPEGGDVDYFVSSGALPTGLSLAGETGVISGTVTGGTYNSSGVTYNFSVEAYDTASNATSRAFSITQLWRDGSSSAAAADSCYDIKQLDATKTNGNYYIGPAGSGTSSYCFMTAPWGEPDYYLLTPYGNIATGHTSGNNSTYGFYHTDQRNTGSHPPETNQGTESFDYNCDACGPAQNGTNGTGYRYNVPANHVLEYYTARSHCGRGTTWGYPGQTNSCSNGGASYNCNDVFRFNNTSTSTYVEFQQWSDNCGDPNQATFVGVSKVSGTTRPSPGSSEWNKYLRSVSWNN